MTTTDIIMGGAIGLLAASILALAVDLISMYLSAEVRIAIHQAFARREAIENVGRVEIAGVE